MSKSSYSNFLDVFFFLFELGVSCIHLAYLGCAPMRVFLKYTLRIKKEKYCNFRRDELVTRVVMRW